MIRCLIDDKQNKQKRCRSGMQLCMGAQHVEWLTAALPDGWKGRFSMCLHRCDNALCPGGGQQQRAGQSASHAQNGRIMKGVMMMRKSTASGQLPSMTKMSADTKTKTKLYA